MVALIHSLLWVVHTIVYLLIDPPASGFLNDYLISFAGWYPLFGARAHAESHEKSSLQTPKVVRSWGRGEQKISDENKNSPGVSSREYATTGT